MPWPACVGGHLCTCRASPLPPLLPRLDDCLRLLRLALLLQQLWADLGQLKHLHAAFDVTPQIALSYPRQEIGPAPALTGPASTARCDASAGTPMPSHKTRQKRGWECVSRRKSTDTDRAARLLSGRHRAGHPTQLMAQAAAAEGPKHAAGAAAGCRRARCAGCSQASGLLLL